MAESERDDLVQDADEALRHPIEAGPGPLRSDDPVLLTTSIHGHRNGMGLVHLRPEETGPQTIDPFLPLLDRHHVGTYHHDTDVVHPRRAIDVRHRVMHRHDDIVLPTTATRHSHTTDATTTTLGTIRKTVERKTKRR